MSTIYEKQPDGKYRPITTHLSAGEEITKKGPPITPAEVIVRRQEQQARIQTQRENLDVEDAECIAEIEAMKKLITSEL